MKPCTPGMGTKFFEQVLFITIPTLQKKNYQGIKN